MSVKKTTNKTTWEFCTRYTDVQGNRKQKRLRGFITKREAQEAERDFLNSLNHNGILERDDMTVSKLIDLYLEARKPEIKANTFQSLTNFCSKHIRPFLGNVKVSNLNQNTVASFHKYLLDDVGVKLSSAKTIHGKLIAMIRYAEVHYNIPMISHKLRPPKIVGLLEEKRLKFYTPEQVREFANAARSVNDLIANMIIVLAQTGLRIGELTGLTYKHIDFEKKKILVRQTAYYTMLDGKSQMTISAPKTRSSIRDVLMTSETFDIIKAMYEADKLIVGFTKEFYIFSNAKTNALPYYSILRYFNAAHAKTTLPKITIHDLRHSHASLLIHLGADVLLVSKRLGHKDVTTTLNIYSHLFPERENTIIDTLNEHLK